MEDDDAYSDQDMFNTEPDTDDDVMHGVGVTFSRFRIQTMTSFVHCLVG
jgi:hypothetical protein